MSALLQRLLTLLFLISCVSLPTALCQTQAPEINTSGFKAPELFRFIHDGRFDRFKNDMEFKLTYASYVEIFSRKCPASLPRDKVEITQVVNTYSSQLNVLFRGSRIAGVWTSQTLEDSRVVGTGIYADPKYVPLYKLTTVGVIADMFKAGMRGESDAMIYSVNEALQLIVESRQDVALMTERHGCDSAVVKRFADNLLRFAEGRPSAQEQGGEGTFFERECARKLPGIVAGARAAACKCLQKEFKPALPLQEIQLLEDEFTPERFLLTSVSKVGLHAKVASCLQQ